MSPSLVHDTLTPDVETATAEYRRRFAGEVGRFFLDTQRAAVNRLLRSATQGHLRVLEVGGGHGQLTPFLLEAGHDVWVHGSAPSCVQQIRPLMARHPGRLHFVVSSSWWLPFADRSFDAVIAVRLLSHVERWEALLRELGRIARDLLILDYANLASVNVMTPLFWGVKRRIEGNTRPYFCYTTGRIRRCLREFGFNRFSAEKQFVLPMGLHRRLGRSACSAAIERLCRRLGLARLIGSPVMLMAMRADGERSGRGCGNGSPA